MRNNEGGEQWSNLGYILKMNPTEFITLFPKVIQRQNGRENGSKIFCQTNRKLDMCFLT